LALNLFNFLIKNFLFLDFT